MGEGVPLQYETYRKTVDQARTKYGGSEALPRTPDEADPRSVVSQEKIEEDPRLKTMWAGYAFSVDFREERGHAYMLEDQTFTKRQAVVKQPGSCMQCHGSVYVLQEARERRPPGRLPQDERDAVHGDAQARGPPGRLHRLPRSRDDGAAGDAARVHQRDPRAQGEAGSEGLRREQERLSEGDARVRLRSSATSSTTSRATTSSSPIRGRRGSRSTTSPATTTR